MRWAALASLLFIAGCVGGSILADKPSDPSKAAFIAVDAPEHFSIHPTGHSDGEKDLQAPGIWVSDGWFVLYHSCGRPKDAQVETLSEHYTIHFKGGHRYTLGCDPDARDKITLVDETTGDTL